MFRHAFLPMLSAVAVTAADAPKAAVGFLAAATAIDVAAPATVVAGTAPVTLAAAAAHGTRS
ncbi:hypothetical protein ACO0M4_11655 [Streptomyces sp. RGM 3693]|uniref:hypothetical protein n=1 Tax=Streptomyces sp. RGM 3693 TaxID=3413284 RepID=UPI003D2B9556